MLVDLLAVLLGDQHAVCLVVEGVEKEERVERVGGRSTNASFREKRPES